MDGIKFRCWDNFNAEFTYSEIMGLSKFFTDFEMRIEGDDKCFLEQFINHKDINGKEICEGDKVKASIYADEIPQILEVKYSEEFTAFIIDYEDSDSDCICIGCFPGTLEIIGKTHEGKS